jgi:hypothetical protein
MVYRLIPAAALCAAAVAHADETRLFSMEFVCPALQGAQCVPATEVSRLQVSGSIPEAGIFTFAGERLLDLSFFVEPNGRSDWTLANAQAQPASVTFTNAVLTGISYWAFLSPDRTSSSDPQLLVHGLDVTFAPPMFEWTITTAQPVPEPGSWSSLLVGLGLLSVSMRGRRCNPSNSTATTLYPLHKSAESQL